MAVWQIQLLGGLRATRGNSVIAQFPSRPIAMLLARLALEPQRRHSREELIELLWPGVELDIGRNRLRQVLSTLRRLLEPPGVTPYSIIDADRQTVGLAADAIDSDVREFEQLFRQGAIAQALDRYRGDLLPGFLDEWVEDERTRLSALFERAETLYRRIGQPRWEHRVRLSRAGCLAGLRRHKEARRVLDQCEQYFARLDSIADLIAVANMTGFLESAQEHWQEALAAGRRCVQLAWDRHAHLYLATALWNLPHPLVMLGEHSVAARLMAFAARFWERGVGPLSAGERATVEQERKRAAKVLGSPHAETLWAEGAALSLPQAVQLALTGCD